MTDFSWNAGSEAGDDPFLNRGDNEKNDFDNESLYLYTDSLTDSECLLSSTPSSASSDHFYSFDDFGHLNGINTPTEAAIGFSASSDDDVFLESSPFDEILGGATTSQAKLAASGSQPATSTKPKESTSSQVQEQTALITTTDATSKGKTVTRIIRFPLQTGADGAQPVIISSESEIVKMTFVTAETTVQDAIMAAGIGVKNFPPRRFRAPENQPKLFPLTPLPSNKRVILKRPLAKIAPSTSAAVDPVSKDTESTEPTPSDDEEDWDKDMPVLTREAPLNPEQLPPSLHRPVAPAVVSFPCNKCEKTLPTRHALGKHMHLHDSPRFKCRICHRAFFDRTKLRRHQLVHTGAKNYECHICHQLFALEYNLKAHLHTHRMFKVCRVDDDNNFLPPVVVARSRLTALPHRQVPL